MKLTDKQQNIIDTLGYENPIQFLTHYPYRYDFLESRPVDTWKIGDTVVFEGELISPFRHVRLGGKRTMTRFEVKTDDTLVKVSIFNRPYLNAGHYRERIVVTGTVQADNAIVASAVTNKTLDEVTGIKPVYALKAGIKNYEVQRLMTKILKQAAPQDHLPQVFEKRYRLMPMSQAIKTTHEPQSKESLQLALRTLKYDEFLRYHLSVALNNRHLDFGVSRQFDASYIQDLIAHLPYTLSDGQMSSLNEILEDLRKPKQMNRLLQGDVGSGKTIVAFISALAAIQSGYQVAILAPTEILTHQHYQSFESLFGEKVISDVLTTNTEDRVTVLDQLQKGQTNIIFGTHALFTEDVVFRNLGYVVIDEQHRFGVKQRQSLLSKGEDVDALMLSATPIPRTLANSLFFDLEVSTIAGYPAHRKQIETHIVKENSIRSILDVIQSHLDESGQVYVVCAAIEEGERPNVRSVHQIHEQLRKLFPNYEVGMLHGKMPGLAKENIMQAFKDKNIDILVSTTVIEVGMDVHNANLMIVYNAEQFGLATLHQLRGRVGRGQKQGLCYLLSSSESEISVQRLEALEKSHDGFELAMEDMRLRGYGDALGVRQSGIPNFILGDIENDEKILRQAKLDAKEILENQNNPDFEAIIKQVHSQDYLITM